MKQCEECQGEGKVRKEPNSPYEHDAVCEACFGMGEIEEDINDDIKKC